MAKKNNFYFAQRSTEKCVMLTSSKTVYMPPRKQSRHKRPPTPPPTPPPTRSWKKRRGGRVMVIHRHLPQTSSLTGLAWTNILSEMQSFTPSRVERETRDIQLGGDFPKMTASGTL